MGLEFGVTMLLESTFRRVFDASHRVCLFLTNSSCRAVRLQERIPRAERFSAILQLLSWCMDLKDNRRHLPDLQPARLTGSTVVEKFSIAGTRRVIDSYERTFGRTLAWYVGMTARQPSRGDVRDWTRSAVLVSD